MYKINVAGMGSTIVDSMEEGKNWLKEKGWTNLQYDMEELKSMYEVFVGGVSVGLVFNMSDAQWILKDYGIGGEEYESEQADYEIRRVKLYELVVDNRIVARGKTREELEELAKDYIPSYKTYSIEEM